MTLIDLGDGRQVTVGSDLGQIRLSLWANRGSLGIQLTARQAMDLRRALFDACYPNANLQKPSDQI